MLVPDFSPFAPYIYVHSFTANLRAAVRSGRHRDLAARRVRESRGKNLNAVLCNKQCVLELRRPATVGGNAGPVIRPGPVLVGAKCDHRLDGEAHARLGLANSLVFGIVGHVGCAVEKLIDAVATVGLNYATVVGFCNLLNRVAVVAEESAGLNELDRFFQRVSCGFDNAYAVRVLVRLADVVSLVEVAVEATVVKRNVDVQNVTILQRTLVGNAVADNLVR